MLKNAYFLKKKEKTVKIASASEAPVCLRRLEASLLDLYVVILACY